MYMVKNTFTYLTVYKFFGSYLVGFKVFYLFFLMYVVLLARSRLAHINSKLLQQIVEKQSASRIFHMEEDAIEEFSREGLLSTLEAEHLLEDVQRAAAVD